MIKYNQDEISPSMWNFNKVTPNESNSGVGKNTITNVGNTVVGISVHDEINISFVLYVYGGAQILFRIAVINDTSCTVDIPSGVGHPKPILITVVILLEVY